MSIHSSVRIALIALAVASAGRLAAQEVKYDYDRTADFTKFKTYKWVQIDGATSPGQLEDKNIRAAIDAELAKKGLTVKPADPVDVFLAYQVSVEQDKEINSYGGGLGWRGLNQATISNVNVGTLVIDVYVPSSKSMAWQGSGMKEVSNDQDPDKRQEKLQKSVAKILKNYPPPKK